MTHRTDEWTGCYPSNWKGLIVPQAMSHPAKFSSRLIRRIYDHMIENRWLRIGDSVLDPFGGVALGALEAMRHGMNWTGCELEPKFVDLGNENIALWNKKFSTMPHWGSASLLQGDSRFILQVVAGVPRMVVSSPPYAETDINYHRNGLLEDGKEKYRRPYMDGQVPDYGSTEGQLGAMHPGDFDSVISSPPYNPPMSQDHNGTRGGQRGTTPSELGAFVKYGNTPGQLEGMSMDGFDSVISSPPFRHSEGGTPEPKPGGSIDHALYARHAAGNSAADGYGKTPGNLANMDEPPGDFHATVSSPPYEKNIAHDGGPINKFEGGTAFLDQKYGDEEGNIGNDSGETFWQAARQIVEQVHLALAPGGHAVWVVKDYVKNKQIVPFSDQWRQLCESVGFVTLHEHHAMLVHHKGSSHTLEGGIVEHRTESKSFFRRLAEKKGSPRIDYETVLCMVKE